MDRVFYVYLHRKKTNNEIFYVGKGKGSRSTSRSGRSHHWRNIEKKHGLTVEIYREGLSEEEAYALEINLIQELRESGGKICNIANGGNGGLSGIKLSEDHKEKLRKAKIGKKQMPEHALKSATAKLGKSQPRDAVEAVISKKRKPVINSDGDIFESACEAARAMANKLGVYPSQGNISMAARGERKEAYGKAWSYDVSKIPAPPSGIKSTMKKIFCSNGMEFKSTQDATRWVKSWRGSANNQCITECARRASGTAYGFSWRYEE